MAFTVAARQTGNSGPSAEQSHTTASETPTADSLFLAGAGAQNGNHDNDPAPTISGGSLSYTPVDVIGADPAIPWAGSDSFRNSSALWRAAVGGSPSAFGVTADFNPSILMFNYAVLCADVTGHNAASPVVQSAVDGATVNPPSDTASRTVTLASTPSVGNLVVAWFFAGADDAGGFGAVTLGGQSMIVLTEQDTAFIQGVIAYRVADGTETGGAVTVADLGDTVGNWTGHAVEIAAQSGTELTATSTTQAQTATQAALTQTHGLTAASATQAQTATQAAISVGTDLTPASAVQGQQATAAVLTQVHELAPASTVQGQTATAAGLVQTHELAPASTVQAQTADAASVSRNLLLPSSTVQGQQATAAATLTTHHQLTVHSARHAHRAQALHRLAPATPFPDPLDVIVEVALGVDPQSNPLEWTWTDATPDLRALDGIRGRRGRQDEQSQIHSGQGSLGLGNGHGNWTPGNPLSPFYGQLGLDVPIRVRPNPPPPLDSSVLLFDEFTRDYPSPAGWGSPNVGVRWSNDTAGGLAHVTGGQGVIAPDLGGLPVMACAVLFMDGDIVASVSPHQVTTGGNIEAGVTYRWIGMYYVSVAFDEGGQIDYVALFADFFGRVVAVVEDPGTYQADDVFWLRIRAEGDRHRVRFWKDGDPEPGGWLIDATDNGESAVAVVNGMVDVPTGGWVAGWVGLWAFRSSLNTNTDPTVGFGHIEAVGKIPPLIYGTVASWEPDWPDGDLSDPDTGYEGWSRVAVTAAGPLRHLFQGRPALHSPLRRSVEAITDVVAYWPLEGDSARFSSPISGVAPALTGSGLSAGSVDGPAGSDRLPRFSGTAPDSGWRGLVPAHTPDPGGWRVDWLFRQDESTASVGASWRTCILIGTTGSPVTQWRVVTTGLGRLEVWAYDDEGDIIYQAGLAHDAAFFGDWVRFMLLVRPDSGDIGYTLFALRPTPDATDLGSFLDTVGAPSDDVGRVTRVGSLNLGEPETPRSWGHAAVCRDLSVDPYAGGADHGHTGELATNRVIRLCLEERVNASVMATSSPGGLGTGERMGPQRIATLLELLRDCEATDGGVLFEARWNLGVVYRARNAIVGQQPRLVLDASASVPEITPSLRPVTDDQHVATDVTATSTSGAQARVLAENAFDDRRLPLNRYQDPIRVNPADDGRLEHLAAWRAHLGSWPGARYPTIVPALSAAPWLIPLWAGAEIGDLVHVVGLPPQHPPGPVGLILQGVADTVHPLSWSGQGNASPGGPWVAGVIEGGGVDAGLDGIDSASSTLDADFTAGVDIAMTVATTGPLWTTDPDDYPLNIEVAGVILRVLTVTGATSPQTFRVRQNPVNGITKTIPAGTAVRLALPARLTL